METLHSQLRRYRPVKVRALDEEHEETMLEPTGERGRWQRLIDSIPPGTTRIEMLNAKGSVIKALPLEVEADLKTPTTTTSKATAQTEIGQLLGLMLKAQESALDRSRLEVGSLVDGYKQLAETVCGRLMQLESTLGEVLKMVFDATEASARAAAGNQEPESPADKMAGKLISLLVPGSDTPNGEAKKEG